MKNLLLFSMLLFFFCCKPATKEETTTPEPVAAKPVAIPFAGDWLNEKYYNLILDKKAPRDAQEKVENAFISIPAYMNDTTVMVYGWHESGPDIVVVQKDNQYQLWEIQGDSLDKMAFPVTVIDADHLQLGEDHFVRIHPAHGKYDNALILEEILFKGKYKLKNGGEVEFKNNGEVTGLGQYKYYTVLIDYLDAGLDVDQVAMGENPDSLTYFGFKMKDKTLDIYNLKCLEFSDGRCQQVTWGKVAYQLTRQ